MAVPAIRTRACTPLARRWVALLGLMVALSASAQAKRSHRASSSDDKRSIQVADLERHYLLHVPESLPKGKAVPLVLVFHGGGSHARNMPRFTGFDRLADKQGFVVAYPDSYNKSWNDTRGLSPADDVGFVRALIDELTHAYPIDKKRIYATGISNGGFFSQRLACDLTGKIAAVASVAATMPEPLLPVCKPSRPISVMFMHGTDDPLVHVDGGAVLKDRGRNISLADAVKFWRNFDHTSDTPASEELLDRDPEDETRIHRDVYGGGKQGTEVMVYTIQGGGHTWPGGPQYLPVFLVGRASRDMDATEIIWTFFQKQALP